MESDVTRVALNTPRELKEFIDRYHESLSETILINLCNKILEAAIEYYHNIENKYSNLDLLSNFNIVEIPLEYEMYHNVILPTINTLLEHSLIYHYTLESLEVYYVSTYQIILKRKGVRR